MRMWLIIHKNTELKHKLGTQVIQVRGKKLASSYYGSMCLTVLLIILI